jgi:hypothetical protein
MMAWFNRDDDMAHTVHPRASEARAAFDHGRILASTVSADRHAFIAGNPGLDDYVTWSVWAGPGTTQWFCLEKAHRCDSDECACCNGESLD